jgi:hypothetical protein
MVSKERAWCRKDKRVSGSIDLAAYKKLCIRHMTRLELF